MKQHLQGMVMGILVMTLLLGTITVFAATTRTIEVTVGNIRTTLFGQEFVVRDNQGMVIEPFTYNNRLYVPVDTILHAMGENVQWNAATGILNFGEANQQPTQATGTRAIFLEVAPPYDVSTPARVGMIRDISMGGIRYNDNILRFVNQGVRTPRSEHSMHNLGGRYTVLTGTLGRIDGGGTHAMPRTFNFIGDGRILRSFEFSDTDFPREISVDVTGVTQLRIEFVTPRANTGNTAAAVPYALVNATLQ